MECGVSLSAAASSLCPQKPRVMAGNSEAGGQAAAGPGGGERGQAPGHHDDEEGEKYLYDKIMSGRKRRVRGAVSRPTSQPKAPGGASQMSPGLVALPSDSGPGKILRECCVQQSLRGGKVAHARTAWWSVLTAPQCSFVHVITRVL